MTHFPSDQALREHVLYLLNGGGAHLDFERAIAGMPANLQGAKVEGIPHTPWRLLEHMRIAQWDILEFSRNAKHVSPDFPDGYWPKTDGPSDVEAWDKSAKAFRADLQAMIDLVVDPGTDLFAPIPHGDGQTILREAYWWPITMPITSANWYCNRSHPAQHLFVPGTRVTLVRGHR